MVRLVVLSKQVNLYRKEMKVEKFHKYVKETRTYIYPMASYMKENYPELSNGVTILK